MTLPGTTSAAPATAGAPSAAAAARAGRRGGMRMAAASSPSVRRVVINNPIGAGSSGLQARARDNDRMTTRFFPRDEYFMRLALREAERSLAHDDVPVGCVIARDGEVLAAAPNEREL